MTSDIQSLYFDDVLGHNSRLLWPVKTGAYYWLDSAHVLEADGNCIDLSGAGVCHRASFTFFNRNLSDANDSHEVASGDVSTNGAVTLLPDGHRFIWLLDGVLLVQSL